MHFMPRFFALTMERTAAPAKTATIPKIITFPIRLLLFYPYLCQYFMSLCRFAQAALFWLSLFSKNDMMKEKIGETDHELH